MARLTRRQLLQKIDALDPPIAKAFRAAFVGVRAQAQINRLAELISAGRLDDMAEELGINSARFADLAESIRTVYGAGGKEGAKEIPVLRGPGDSRVRIGFDLRNARAETWLRNESSRLVTEIVADQRNAIRIAVSEGTVLGQNPRATALDIVGRIGANGRRSGGIVGLTSQQTDYVLSARLQLQSGDATVMRGYFDRVRRDKRFDGIVSRAIAEGKAVVPTDVEKIVGRYADRLLQLRGENIARTEALAAFNEAREEAFRQATDTGLVKPQNVRKAWSHSGSRNPREAHIEMDGQEVGLDEAFQSPSGAQLLHPGDTSLGAGPEDIVNCGCIAEYRIDQIAQAMEA
jgi:hypothetical protein